MDDALLDVVLTWLDEFPLDPEAERILLAACDSETALAAELAGEDREETERATGRADAQPTGAHLRSVTVCGFRGIGAAATLNLEPGPGLTLVVGRNGSGKSSFAEGLKVLLTGDLRCWQDHPAWRAGWLNLHAPDRTRLSADLVIEDTGPAVPDEIDAGWTT
ncbi:MAG TPA: AAA family ATPase [Streptosporangiaceae bacterium]|nr:AAA family ATPase [Streptosporangiaceae bacterium]